MNCMTHSVQILGRLAALPVVTLLVVIQASVLHMVMLMVKRVVITINFRLEHPPHLDHQGVHSAVCLIDSSDCLSSLLLHTLR